MEVTVQPFFPFIYEPKKQIEPERLYIEIDPLHIKKYEEVAPDEQPKIVIIQL